MDHGDLILGKAPEISAQNPVEGDVLAGIIQNTQHLDDLTDLLCRKIACS